MQNRIYLTVLFSFLFGLCSSIHAKENTWHTKVDARAGLLLEDDNDLGTKDGGKRRNAYASIDGLAGYHFTDFTKFVVKGRAFYATDDINLEPEEGGQPSKKYLELRQLYLHSRHLGTQSLSGLIGRKRLREDTGIWWDRNYTLGELHYQRSLIDFYGAIGRQFMPYRTDESDYAKKDEDILRVLAAVNWQFRLNHYLDFKYAYLKDSSGEGNTIQTDDKSGIDLRDPDVAWLGVAAHGKTALSPALKFSYQAGMTYQTGTVVDYTLSNNAITQRHEQDVNAWLAHLELHVQFNNDYHPLIGTHFYTTSDNTDENTDGRFFQTGLESNKAKITQTNDFITKFNDAYRPELSNISILGLFYGMSMTKNTDLNIVYNFFNRVNDSVDIGYSSVNAPLVDGESHLGQGADIFVSYRPEFKHWLIEKSLLRLRLSGFWPGDAYGSDVNNHKYRTVAEWKVRY